MFCLMYRFALRCFLCAATLNLSWNVDLVSCIETDDGCSDRVQYGLHSNDDFDVELLLESDAEAHDLQLLQTQLQLKVRRQTGSAADAANTEQLVAATDSQNSSSISHERVGQTIVHAVTSASHHGTNDQVLSNAVIGRHDASHADPFGLRQQVLDFTKEVRAPEEKWAVAALVALCCFSIVAPSLLFWFLRNTKKEDKPACSFGLKATAGFFIVVFFIAGTYLTTWYFAGAVLKTAISKADTTFLGVKVDSERMALNPFVGKLVVDGLRIENPQGWRSDHLLTCKSLLIDVSMRSVIFSFAHRLTIQRLDLDSCDVIYEQALTTSNVEDVVHHLGSTSGSGEKRQSDNRQQLQISVQEVSIQNLWAKGTLYLTGDNGISLAIPNMHWDDFTKEESGKNSGEEIVSFLLATILNSVLRVFKR